MPSRLRSERSFRNMPMTFEEGHAICWPVHGGFRFGVIMSASHVGTIDVYPVYLAETGTKFYDSGGSNRKEHGHNVRLTDCPPPFDYLCVNSALKSCYAKADPSMMLSFSHDDIIERHVQVIDRGVKVSDRDMADIRDHVWRDEAQHHKRPSDPSSVLSRLLDTIHDRDGPEF